MPKRRGKGQTRAEASKRREAHWRSILSRQRRSGLNHTDFCRRQSISRNAYFWWKREIQKRDEKRRRKQPSGAKRGSSSLVEVTVTPPTSGEEGPRAFEVILTNQRVVRVAADFEAESLKRLVRVLEDEAC